jgi:hypothetical protein
MAITPISSYPLVWQLPEAHRSFPDRGVAARFISPEPFRQEWMSRVRAAEEKDGPSSTKLHMLCKL